MKALIKGVDVLLEAHKVGGRGDQARPTSWDEDNDSLTSDSGPPTPVAVGQARDARLSVTHEDPRVGKPLTPGTSATSGNQRRGSTVSQQR